MDVVKGREEINDDFKVLFWVINNMEMFFVGREKVERIGLGEGGE